MVNIKKYSYPIHIYKNTFTLNTFLTVLIILIISASPVVSQNNLINEKNFLYDYSYHKNDTLIKKQRKFKTISALFLSAGGGLSVPFGSFKNNSVVSFGLLGRLEFASTAIFPVVIGGEVNYFTYNGTDEFKTSNLLRGLKTKIISAGINIEYSLVKLLRSSFTMPFLTIDVKGNTIKREYDEEKSLEELPRNESLISFGAGIGFTLFIFDIYGKYNYMKDKSYAGFYIKTKIPLIRF
jgi:hypothetical protein